MTARHIRLVAAIGIAVLLVGGCTAADEPPGDPGRSRLLGALPPAAAVGGVYVIVPSRAGRLSPGSRIAPVLGRLAFDADLHVETVGPVVVLLTGIDPAAELPPGAARIDDVVAFGAEPHLAEVRARLAAEAAPSDDLTALAALRAPVAYAGPLPEDLSGTVTVALETDRLVAEIRTAAPAFLVADAVRERLETGSLPGSPGRRWSNLLRDAEVEARGRVVRVTATPDGLDGPLLRRLLDGQAFLSA